MAAEPVDGGGGAGTAGGGGGAAAVGASGAPAVVHGAAAGAFGSGELVSERAWDVGRVLCCSSAQIREALDRW